MNMGMPVFSFGKKHSIGNFLWGRSWQKSSRSIKMLYLYNKWPSHTRYKVSRVLTMHSICNFSQFYYFITFYNIHIYDLKILASRYAVWNMATNSTNQKHARLKPSWFVKVIIPHSNLQTKYSGFFLNVLLVTYLHRVAFVRYILIYEK